MMKIQVSGSLSAIRNLNRVNPRMQSNLESSFDFHVRSEYNVPSEKPSETLNVQLINQDETDSLFTSLRDVNVFTAVTIIDNGSTSHLPLVFGNNELTVRLLGVQSHCLLSDMKEMDSTRLFRLKDIRERSDLSEIVLRTSDVAIFNMNAIRRGDQVGNGQSNTTGLSIEEACLIAKFIGASDLITDVYFAGINLHDDPFDMMSTNLSNMLWYLSEGSQMRNIDSEIESEDNLVFSVVPDTLDHEIQFVQSCQTGRWWVKVPTDDGDMHMACTKDDYEQACENNITDRLAGALQLD